ncbi:TetR/AcrR family transcriptional regulator [Cryptosporangium arvum]|uniref:TetR/AcrR family transcriptional regulator n=1 Tax=Cryptosporangium arvum TaxID=80871 RepID=UPI0004ADB371|nr:TetR/AcrR family transcriptional regulator [Cryptosporangium arvum]
MSEAKGPGGRPRSEQAREAVLHAVDDLLLEVGYAALTMKGIAERAGVGRQTVYRWWSTKAEVLFEASVADVAEELAVPPADATEQPADAALGVVTAYLDAFVRFLAHSPAGIAHRTLLGAAQHDPAVKALVDADDALVASARTVVERARPGRSVSDQEAAQLIGPPLFWIMTGRDPADLDTGELARGFLAAHP